MEFNQAKEILNILYDYYPHINKQVSETFNKTWLRVIVKGDYVKTLNKLEEYSLDNKFPPSLADFLVLPPKKLETVDAQQRQEAEVKAYRSDPEKAKIHDAKLEELQQRLRRVGVDKQSEDYR